MRILMARIRFCRVVCSMFLILALFAAAAPLSAAKGGQVPFHAFFDTVFQSSSGFPIVDIKVQGQGHAQHLGRSTTFSNDEQVNLSTGHATATFTLISASGDTVVTHNVFETTQVAGGVTFSGTYEVIGGTGRFAGASGHGTLTGSALFTGPGIGVGDFTLDGTISSPGSLH